MAETPNNKVSTEKFYEAQLDTNDKIAAMERRIMAELKGVPKQVETNDKEITRLRNRFNFWSSGNSLGLLATAALAYLRGG